MKKYSVEEFLKKYTNARHISCAVHLLNGEFMTFMNSSCSQIKSFISNKVVKFIVCR